MMIQTTTGLGRDHDADSDKRICSLFFFSVSMQCVMMMEEGASSPLLVDECECVMMMVGTDKSLYCVYVICE